MSEPGHFNASTDVLAQLQRAETLDNPWPLYAWLRDNDAVHRVRPGLYLLSRYADANWLMQEHGAFRAPAPAGTQPAPSRSLQLLASAITGTVPPTHTRLRRLVARDFTPRRVETLTGSVRSICDELLAELAGQLHDGEVVDLHGLSQQLPMRVLLALLGVPQADWRWLALTVWTIVSGLSPGATADAVADADQA